MDSLIVALLNLSRVSNELIAEIRRDEQNFAHLEVYGRMMKQLAELEDAQLRVQADALHDERLRQKRTGEVVRPRSLEAMLADVQNAYDAVQAVVSERCSGPDA